MFSLSIKVRVSEDYLLDPLQWKIGISSIFAYALNVRPYKDTFWTSKNESVNPRYNGRSKVLFFYLYMH